MSLLAGERLLTPVTIGLIRRGPVRVRFMSDGREQRPQVSSQRVPNGEGLVCVSFGALADCANAVDDSPRSFEGRRRPCRSPGGFRWFFYRINGAVRFAAKTHERQSELLVRISESVTRDFVWFSDTPADPEFTLTGSGESPDSPAELVFADAVLVAFFLPTERTVCVYFPTARNTEGCARKFAGEYMRRTFGCNCEVGVERGEWAFRVRLPPEGDIRSTDQHAIHFIVQRERKIDWRWPNGTLTSDAVSQIATLAGLPEDRLVCRCGETGPPFKLSALPRQVLYIQELAGQTVEVREP
jgi:hypothetical protein